MNIIISRIAKDEFESAKEFYELEISGLGKKFQQEIKQALLRIQQFPHACPFERDEVRRYILLKFPFKILFSIQNDSIIVLAFAHQHRHPEYWIDRLRT